MTERTCDVDDCSNSHRARGLCSTHYNQRHQPARHARMTTACTVCGRLVERPTKGDRRAACSVACRTVLQSGPPRRSTSAYDWTTDAMRRARSAGATDVDHVARFAVFERDAWTCYLCHLTLAPDTDPFDPLSPTVDHVVALSRGGQHVLGNLRTACLHCNSAKGDAAA